MTLSPLASIKGWFKFTAETTYMMYLLVCENWNVQFTCLSMLVNSCRTIFLAISLKKKKCLLTSCTPPPTPPHPAGAPVAYSTKSKKIRNSESAWYDGKRERAGAPLPFFPRPIIPRAFLFFPSPQSPNDTKRLLRRREPFDTPVSRRFSYFQLVMSLQKCARMV